MALVGATPILGAVDDRRVTVRMVENARMTQSPRIRTLLAGAALALLHLAVRADALAPGDVPPPQIGYAQSGDTVLLPSYAGKAVIVTFWASWCSYCLKELPILENVQTKAGKAQIAVIAVNIEEREVFRRLLRIMNKSMHIELVSDANGEARKAFGVGPIPHMLIIGRDGRIQKVWTGYSEDSLEEIAADINVALRPLP
jgi:thiol-disulfide isomerase/thioredoxin